MNQPAKFRRQRAALWAVPLASALLVAACGSDNKSSGSGSTTTAASGTTGGVTTAGATTTSASGATTTSAAARDVNLKGVCPDTVVFQTDWNPEAEHGQLYSLIGDGYTVDTAKTRVSGPLMSRGKDTGVKVEVRSGGPAIGFQSVTSQLYGDPNVLLGYVSTDEQISNSATFPTKAVVATFNINPQIIMWDPATYPNVKTIAGLKATGAKVRYFSGAAYMDYLTQSGQLDKNQVDGSYDGTPANFVADGGKSAQQGFVSAEPYFYEKVLKDWMKPIAFQLIHDAGWTAYAQDMATTPDKVTKYADCFKKLVPIIQQSQVDFVKNPDKANALILDLVTKYNNGWLYDAGQAKASVAAQLQYKLVANSPDGTLGSFDMDRVAKFVTTAVPIYQASNSKPKAGLKAEDLVTNEFVDKSIHL
jgi:hypothetical protein